MHELGKKTCVHCVFFALLQEYRAADAGPGGAFAALIMGMLPGGIKAAFCPSRAQADTTQPWSWACLHIGKLET